jgi:hypothetical protein
MGIFQPQTVGHFFPLQMWGYQLTTRNIADIKHQTLEISTKSNLVDIQPQKVVCFFFILA